MLLKIYFIVDSSLADTRIHKLRLPSNVNLCFNITLDSDLIPVLKTVYSSSFKYPILLLFDKSVIISEQLNTSFYDYIMSVIFHYKYLKYRLNTPVFALDCDQKDISFSAKKFSEKLTNECRANGFADCDFVSYTVGDYKREEKSANAALGKKIESDYYSALLSAKSTVDGFFIQVNSIDELPEIINNLRECEKSFSINSPGRFELLQNLFDLERENLTLGLKTHILEQRLNSIQNIFSFQNLTEQGSRKRISQIVDFYRNEYEILPLWYKRLGHIIKVIMGKRTFRSLFNDNVKKYKV